MLTVKPREAVAQRLYSFNNTDIYYIQTSKFKTNTISFFFIDNLTKDTVSKNALTPAVLRRGCGSYPSMPSISLQLEELYGSSFDCGVVKKGEYHIIYFHTEYIAERFVEDIEEFFKKPLKLIVDIITDPVTENDLFKSGYVEQEKENLKSLIERRVNDKVQYAIDRCFEEMCKDEPFGIYDYGDIPGLAEVSENELYKHYKNVIAHYPLKVFITGDISINNLEWISEELFKIISDHANHKNEHNINTNSNSNIRVDSNSNSRVDSNNRINNNSGSKSNDNSNSRVNSKCIDNGKNKIEYEPKQNKGIFYSKNSKLSGVKQVTESMEVNQAKLSMGFRTNTSPKEDDYYVLLVFNSILGEGVYSKLFQKVREESGLAYYIFSQLEKFKGLSLITCGIEIDDRDKAIDIILKQIDNIKSGNVTKYEYESAVKSIATGIGFLKDNQLQITDYYFSQILAGTNDCFETLLEKIKRISVEKVVNITEKLKLDTIYFLTSKVQGQGQYKQ